MNKNITYWHIQLHPNNMKWNKEKELLETTSLIGLGSLKEGNNQIKQFVDEMKIGDIVLVKRGSIPVALVRVIGEIEIEKNDMNRLDWFKYRREAEVLDYANAEMPPFPQPRGGLRKATNRDTLSYKYIDEWSKVKHFRQLLEDLKEADKYLTKDDIDALKKLLPKESAIEIQSENISLAFGRSRVTHFDSIFIRKYKVFSDFKIERLNRINIFAGFNNTGKTTLLEAIYLLTKQNNIGAFFELVKLKNKLSKLNTHYLNSYFQDEIVISGNFNESKTEIKLKKFEAKDIDKKDDYLSSYEIISTIDEERLNNIIHTFESSPLIRYVDRVEILCSSLFKSPYFYNQQEIINTHSKNVELKEFDLIVQFITNHIDKNIQDIDLTEQNDIKRFLVDSKLFPEKSVDITSYGEGLQRIFEIALSFAYCKNGVLLIDELETAIHYSLLVDFTKFIQELAVKFNVQVFITSHSKECIRAFVENEVYNKDINFYTMLRDENNQIQTIIYDDKVLFDELAQDLEVRGW